MRDQLGPLEELTRIRLDAELAKLRRCSEDLRQRRSEVASLGAALAARSEDLRNTGAADAALCSGQDAIWQAWVARRKRQLSRDAAQAASRREAQLKTALKAFGQAEALAGLRDLENEERRRARARRSQSDPDGTGQSG